MAKNAYIGVGGVARKVKTPYFGIYQDAKTVCSYVEYIRNSGTQSIDTGIYLDFSKDINVEAEISVSATGKRYAYFSTYKNSSYDSFCLEVTADNKLRVYLNANDISATGGSVAANTKYKIKFTFNASSNTYVLYQNGTQVLTGSITYTGTIPYSARIFYDHRDNAASTFPSPCNVYSMSVQNGTNSINLRPAKRTSDNVVCLYDTVSKKFFTNIGAGTFTAGAATGGTETAAAGSYARKVKTGYIGIEGVARQFYSAVPSNYFYYQGDECVDATGGWEDVSSSEGDATPPIMTRNADNLRVYGSKTDGAEKYLQIKIRTNKYVDLSKASKLYVTYKLNAKGTKRQSEAVAEPEINRFRIVLDGSTLIETAMTNDNAQHTTSLNVSSISSGRIYFDVAAYAYTNKQALVDLTIYNVWYE